MQSRFKYLGMNRWMAIPLILGLAQAWRSRFFINYDGVSYLDMGDAFLRGDWHTAINGYFNPLYAWLQAFSRFVLRPSMYWEYPLAHLVNYGIFVVTVFAFEYFLQGLIKDRNDVFAIRSIAYSIFLWSSLVLIPVSMIEPDMVICACVYAALGMLLRRPNTKPVALGAALAIGCYAKAWMFPLALMILFAAWKLLPRRGVFIAASTFLLFPTVDRYAFGLIRSCDNRRHKPTQLCLVCQQRRYGALLARRTPKGRPADTSCTHRPRFTEGLRVRRCLSRYLCHLV